MKVRKPNRIVGIGGQAYPPALPQRPAVLRSVVKEKVAHLLYLYRQVDRTRVNWETRMGSNGPL